MRSQNSKKKDEKDLKRSDISKLTKQNNHKMVKNWLKSHDIDIIALGLKNTFGVKQVAMYIWYNYTIPSALKAFAYAILDSLAVLPRRPDEKYKGIIALLEIKGGCLCYA